MNPHEGYNDMTGARTGTSSLRMRRALLAALALFAGGAAVIAVSAGSDGVDVVAGGAEGARPAIDINEYPGFGTDQSSARRDTAIAYAEAVDRAFLTAECMSRNGFSYEPDVAFPAGTVVQIAAATGIDTSRSVAKDDPALVNAKYLGDLTPGQLDAYYEALVGEDYQAVSRAEKTEGRGLSEEFASGGCQGESWAQIPGIWELRREIMPALTSVRSEVHHSFAEGRQGQVYADCLSSSYGLLVSSRSLPEGEMLPELLDEKAEAAIVDCWQPFEATRQEEIDRQSQAALAVHFERLEQSKQHYVAMERAWLSDARLGAYLLDHAARSQQAMTKSSQEIVEPADDHDHDDHDHGAN